MTPGEQVRALALLADHLELLREIEGANKLSPGSTRAIRDLTRATDSFLSCAEAQPIPVSRPRTQ